MLSLHHGWKRDGLVMARAPHGDGSEVVGDPCIVWDPDHAAWRMFLFFDPPGHATALAVGDQNAAEEWGETTPIEFANPELLPGGTHKPFIVMDAHRPNHAARVDGRYWLLTVSHDGRAREKRVQRAHATSLAGPWTLEERELIPRGQGDAFDAEHVDAVSGYWFPELDTFVYYYMGYPARPQQHVHSPLGSSIGVATQGRGDTEAVKQGVMLTPSPDPEHWAAGWLGGIQIFPGTEHRWVAVLNASPTPPDGSGRLTSEEPAPSLGGFAHTDAEIPTSGWELDEQPIEWVSDIPDDAIERGEGTNLWRQHILVLRDSVRLYYNSGFYGREQLYSKTADRAVAGIADTA
ncbi:hypothetical protein [Homoserinibacter sp. YIM 151385]|uniref:hypothetical protein n=1 Tax=Homoserinibacter sp. YIM 151385 TaxID=2985506 RepID=UPI0022EFFA70|nr:hypothetical protein [Homoserinibacter sp. YIM 151385]WBU37450.1 hypothetical protein OF852_11065 [Homoserinibacter sp. YIM 151385]